MSYSQAQALSDDITKQLGLIDSQIISYNNFANTVAVNLSNMKAIEESIKLKEELNAILIQSSKIMRDKAKNHFEKIVTDALQFVTQDTAYKFVIEENMKRGKPSYEFYIESMVDGNISRQKPEDSCGGGFIDIISVTAKTAYLQIFSNPQIMDASLRLDEPGKMVSDLMSVKFAEYIKFLGKQFDKQVIMVTHNENLASIADATFIVEKNRNGISSVTNKTVLDTAINNLLVNIEEDYQEENENATE